MGKVKYTAEFEVRASKRMLYPYIYTASGLSQWMADDVTVNEDGVFNFIWDEEDHKAKMVAHRLNSYVKFEFIPETEEDEEDPSYFELRLDVNELTESLFLRITDYSDMDDQEEWLDLWESLVATLKETVGG